MKIEKTIQIEQLVITESHNQPIKIVLGERSPSEPKRESYLVLDKKDCSNYRIPLSPDIIGHALVCSFESRGTLAFHTIGPLEGTLNYQSLDDNDLLVVSLEQKEVITPSGRMSPPEYEDRSWTLELSSLLRFGGTIDSQSFPFYKFFLDLKEEEYKECKTLFPNPFFRLKLRFVK